MRRMFFLILAATSLSACDAPRLSQEPSAELQADPIQKGDVQETKAQKRTTEGSSAQPAPSASPPSPAIVRANDSSSAAPAPPKKLIPLARIITIATARVAGEVIDVELDDDEDDESATYELEILTSNGRIFEVTLDAHTGKILDVDDD